MKLIELENGTLLEPSDIKFIKTNGKDSIKYYILDPDVYGYEVLVEHFNGPREVKMKLIQLFDKGVL